MAHASTEDQAEVICMCWRQCGCWLSMLLSQAIIKPKIHDPTYCKGQVSYPCSDFNDLGCTVEKEAHRRLLWQPLPQPQPLRNITAWKGNHNFEFLKIVLRMLKCIAFHNCWLWLPLVGWSLGVWPFANEFMDSIKNRRWAFPLPFFVWEVTRFGE